MKRFSLKLALVLGPLAGILYVTSAASTGVNVYNGMSDASAVSALDGEYFVVADDEQTVLRVYSRERQGRDGQQTDEVHAVGPLPAPVLVIRQSGLTSLTFPPASGVTILRNSERLADTNGI